MNKKHLLGFAFAAFVFISTGCKKSSDPGCTLTEPNIVAPAAEVANLQAYVSANHPAAIQHPSGFFYEITAAGTGTVTPASCSAVTVKYTGTLTNGTVFDSNTTGVSFVLGQLIVGWQKGLPLIKKGGSIKLYIPPSLGYGSSAVGSIPPNSNLVFVIQLTDVQ
jgi:FKBP-type peptidyl-prolyl cis-trans isomerase FkpA